MPRRIPMTIFWRIQDFSLGGGAAHRIGQTHEIDPRIPTEGGKTHLQVPRAPAAARTSRREGAKIAVHPEFDGDEEYDELDPVFPRDLVSASKCRLGRLKPLLLVAAEFARGIEVVKI